ncbi:MAG: RNA polymerase-binding protein DksA [Proteobacteria bacterium]|jgi:DnaK suppressor protein|nr:RNA polymerase-binding protein DksA [Pseudomonadota bacterium]
MDKGKQEYFRLFLRQQLDELISEAEKTVVTMTDKEEHFPDPTDRASLESDRNFLLRIRERERKLILKIKEALKRIDDGTFGICEICGGKITEERLKARPVTTQCIECKMGEEAKEKAKEKSRSM